MIRRLIILLLIVGCAPTKPPTASFYIGMTKEEFLIKNPHFLDKDNNFYNPLVNGYTYFEGDNKDLSPSEYLYAFTNGDSLYAVWYGMQFYINKEIDYDKYATPPE